MSINITVTRYEGTDFPEAERYTEWLAERVSAELNGADVEVSWGQRNEVHGADLDLPGYWAEFAAHGYKDVSVTAVIEVADDGEPSTCSDSEGAMDYTARVTVGGRVREGAITLWPDPANGGMGHCGTPVDGWISDNLVAWVRTLDDDSRRAVLAALAARARRDEVEVRFEGAT